MEGKPNRRTGAHPSTYTIVVKEEILELLEGSRRAKDQERVARQNSYSDNRIGDHSTTYIGPPICCFLYPATYNPHYLYSTPYSLLTAGLVRRSPDIPIIPSTMD